ncbi:MAG: adenine phosphoribosyltransferase [Candidatus Nanopelagicales bacterium]
MIPEHLKYAHSLIQDVLDFPKPGIIFKDITPVLLDEKAFSSVLDDFSQQLNGANKVAGIESRGFIFAAALAAKNDLGLVLMRKPGKLPRETHSVDYALEYGTDSLHVHVDSIIAGDSVFLVDDVLATGGTMRAAGELVQLAKANVARAAVFLEISALKGRDLLGNLPLYSSLII